MTKRKQRSDSSRRERRAFTDEFKQEVVRLMHERRANGWTLTQVGRELDVRPDQLREWARRLADREGGLAAAGVVETPEQELRRLRECPAQGGAGLRKKSRGVLREGVAVSGL
jgi:transposase-like protein